MKPVYVIGEVGINANGNLDLAKQLIDVVVESGAQAVKFQKRTIERVYTQAELDKPRESPWGTTTRQQKEGLEFSFEQYAEIARYCGVAGIQWSASCWDELSIELIASLQPRWLKIPSALLTNKPLLRAYRKTGLPLILSTGMSTVAEIDEAVADLDHTVLTLLHCTSTYPCSIDEMNLLCIPWLKRYGKKVGFSSHCKSPWPILGAVALGAEVVECHLTLDHASYGSDQSSSLEPMAFKKFVREIRDLEKALGDGKKRLYDSEIPIKEKLRK
jgi:N-acetylneuraminate synthase